MACLRECGDKQGGRAGFIYRREDVREVGFSISSYNEYKNVLYIHISWLIFTVLRGRIFLRSCFSTLQVRVVGLNTRGSHMKGAVHQVRLSAALRYLNGADCQAMRLA